MLHFHHIPHAEVCHVLLTLGLLMSVLILFQLISSCTGMDAFICLWTHVHVSLGCIPRAIHILNFVECGQMLSTVALLSYSVTSMADSTH